MSEEYTMEVEGQVYKIKRDVEGNGMKIKFEPAEVGSQLSRIKFEPAEVEGRASC